MKILMVQNIDGVAGSERYLLQIMPMLKEQGFEVEFLIFQPQNPLQGIAEFTFQLENIGIKYYTLKRRFTSLFNLKKIIENGKFDIVHSHLIHADLYVSIIRRLSRKKWKFISTKHGYNEQYMEDHGLTVVDKFSKYNYVARFAEKAVDKSIAVSFGLKNIYEGFNIRSKNGMKVIYHGISEKEMGKPKELSNSKHRRIALLGRLVPLKGHITAINFIKELNKTLDCSLDIVGEGYLKEDLKRYVQEIGISEKVNFIGYTNNPKEFINNADLVMLTSKAEGFGLVLIEAMSMGVPVMSNDAPAMNEIIEDGINGYLIKNLNIAELVRKTAELFEDKNLYYSISKNAINTVKSKFNISKKLSETIAFYKRVKLS